MMDDSEIVIAYVQLIEESAELNLKHQEMVIC